jgi:hypothetical protein
MKDALKDPRTKKLMRELMRRFPGTTLITGPMLDEPESGEVLIKVLNAPMIPPGRVHDVARSLIWKLWGDGPHPAYVDAIGPEDSVKYYAKHLPRIPPARASRRARAAPRKRAAAR